MLIRSPSGLSAIHAVVKSGTKSYHGDLFEFLRNGDLNARNFFAARCDSLFFFGGYQGTRTRQDPVDP